MIYRFDGYAKLMRFHEVPTLIWVKMIANLKLVVKIIQFVLIFNYFNEKLNHIINSNTTASLNFTMPIEKISNNNITYVYYSYRIGLFLI